MTCKTCRFQKGGECRGEAPKIIGMAQQSGLVGAKPVAIGAWPALMDLEGWCRLYEPDSTMIKPKLELHK
jgi:hypothetical protein